jgi:predicted transcriptional regulator
MKKTSVYLDDEHLLRLKRAAEAEGRSQSEILREAILLYTSQANQPPRKFAMAGIAPGIARKLGYRSIADIPEDELLEGFGE